MSEHEKIHEYRDALKACLFAAGMLKAFDIPKILESIDHADAVGPILDPTLWMQKSEKMREDKEIFRAALPLYQLAMKLSQRPAQEQHP